MISLLGKTPSRWMQRYFFGPDHPMKMRIWQAFWRRLGYPRLTVAYAADGWISLDPRDYLQREIFEKGSYELEVWQEIARQARSNEVFWDVGAHVGCMTVRAGLNDRIREVHSFEPHPVQREILESNVALNSGTYKIHAVALGEKREEAKLYEGLASNTGLSSLAAASDGRWTPVACDTVDDLVYNDHCPAPTIMKIDVEGWELPVLKGARRLLKEAPPKAIVFEWPCGPEGETNDTRAKEYLESFGYRVSRIPRPSGFIDTRENFLAVKS